MPPLQLIQKFQVEDYKKCQSLNSLLALNKLHTQVNIFGFTFLDLLIKFMKMRLVMATLVKQKRTKASILVFSSISKRSEHLR